MAGKRNIQSNTNFFETSLIGNIKVERYRKNLFGKWVKVEEEIRSKQNLSATHWKAWEKFDNYDGRAKLIIKNGLMKKYETISPDGNDKVIYHRK